MKKKVIIIVSIVTSILAGGCAIFAYFNSRKDEEVL